MFRKVPSERSEDYFQILKPIHGNCKNPGLQYEGKKDNRKKKNSIHSGNSKIHLETEVNTL